jgi:hypothetical protein
MERISTPQSLVVYEPYGAGLLCALVYVTRADDVYRWWMGAGEKELRSAYFMLEHFYASKPTRFYASAGMDLYGGLRVQLGARQPALDKPILLDQDVARELDRVQGVFVAEWLAFDDDGDAGREREAYNRLGLPLGRVAIRSARLGKLAQGERVWSYHTHDFDGQILDHLERYWPLDYRPSRDPSVSVRPH